MKKKTSNFLFLSAAAAVLFISGCARENNSTVHLYTDPQYGFRIARPDCGWILSDETGFADVLVIIKSDSISENFTPNVTVAIEPLPCMMSAFEYGEINRKSLQAQGYDLLFSNRTVINRNLFYDLEFSNRHISPSLRFRCLCLVKNRVGFIITCTAPEKVFAGFAADFGIIVNTFRLLGQP